MSFLRKPIGCVVCLLVLAVPTLTAQVSGRITGSVVDPTGAAIPGARVNVLVPGGTSPLFSVVTNDAGIFDFTSVRPETYEIVAELPGFRSQRLSKVRVEPLRQTTLPPIALSLETVAQTVEVTATDFAVQTGNAEISVTLTNEQLRSLPMANRDVQSLANTQAGVSNSRGNWSINGTRAASTNVTLDGINIQDNLFRENGVSFSPLLLKLDQVEEFTLATSNATGVQGAGSSQLAFRTRSGSNEFHGSAVWENRNSALAANSWFDNQSRLPRPQRNQNQVGGSIGGPVLRDRLFFFGNFEVFRLRQQVSRQRTILTDNARQGIFTYTDSAGTIHQVNVLQAAGTTIDPAMQALLDRTPTGSSINNFLTGDSKADLSRTTGGYAFQQRDDRNTENLTLRLDYKLSPSNFLTGTWLRTHDLVDRGDVTTRTSLSVVPEVTNDGAQNLLSLSWRWSPTSTFTNQFGGGFLLTEALFINDEPAPPYTISLGRTLVGTGVEPLFTNPINEFRPQGRQTDTYNLWNNSSYIRGKHSFQFGYQAMFVRTAPFNDAGIVPIYNLGIGANQVSLTTAQVPGASSADLSEANRLLAVLGGYVNDFQQTFNVTTPNSGYVDGATNLRHFSHDTHALYFTDSWKAPHRLTFDLGVRYELQLPVDERDSLGLFPRLVNNDPVATLLSNSTLDFVGKSVGRTAYETDKNNFAPSLGVAWDPFGDHKTAVRAAYSINYVTDAQIAGIRNSIVTNDGLSSAVSAAGLVGRLSVNKPAVPVPTFKVPRTFADNNTDYGTQVAFGLTDPNLATPYVQQWSLSVQREIGGVVVEARYVGNHGTKLLRAYDFNQVIVRENGFLDDFNRARSNGFLAQTAGGTFNPNYNATIAGSQPLTVFPQMNLTGAGSLTNATVVGLIQRGEVGELANYYYVRRLNNNVVFFRNPYGLGANLMTNASHSTYNALQLEARGRPTRGLTVQGSYTWAKNLSDSYGEAQTRFEAYLDNANPAFEKARTAFDLAHNFKVNWVYELPIGRGRRLSGGKLVWLLTGWSTSGILGFQSGTPFSILAPRGTLNRAARSSLETATSTLTFDQLDDLIGLRMTPTGPVWADPSMKGSDGRAGGADGAAPFPGQVLFNPAPGTIGTLQRRQFSGPWNTSFDFGLRKTTAITERHSIEFFAEATNVLNHPSFFVGDEQVANTSPQFNINSTNFGAISQVLFPARVVQLGLYWRF